jgi:hypothetical protein
MIGRRHAQGSRSGTDRRRVKAAAAVLLAGVALGAVAPATWAEGETTTSVGAGDGAATSTAPDTSAPPTTAGVPDGSDDAGASGGADDAVSTSTTTPGESSPDKAAHEAAKREKDAAKEAAKREKAAAHEADKAAHEAAKREKAAAHDADKAAHEAAKREKAAAQEAAKREKAAAQEAAKREKAAAQEAAKREKAEDEPATDDTAFAQDGSTSETSVEQPRRKPRDRALEAFDRRLAAVQASDLPEDVKAQVVAALTSAKDEVAAVVDPEVQAEAVREHLAAIRAERLARLAGKLTGMADRIDAFADEVGARLGDIPAVTAAKEAVVDARATIATATTPQELRAAWRDLRSARIALRQAIEASTPTTTTTVGGPSPTTDTTTDTHDRHDDGGLSRSAPPRLLAADCREQLGDRVDAVSTQEHVDVGECRRHAAHQRRIAGPVLAGVHPHDPVRQAGQALHLPPEKGRITGLPPVRHDHHDGATGEAATPPPVVERLQGCADPGPSAPVAAVRHGTRERHLRITDGEVPRQAAEARREHEAFGTQATHGAVEHGQIRTGVLLHRARHVGDQDHPAGPVAAAATVHRGRVATGAAG